LEERDIHDRKVNQDVELYHYLVNALPFISLQPKRKCNEVGVVVDNGIVGDLSYLIGGEVSLKL
jgi:hypothetical protein